MTKKKKNEEKGLVAIQNPRTHKKGPIEGVLIPRARMTLKEVADRHYNEIYYDVVESAGETWAEKHDPRIGRIRKAAHSVGANLEVLHDLEDAEADALHHVVDVMTGLRNRNAVIDQLAAAYNEALSNEPENQDGISLAEKYVDYFEEKIKKHIKKQLGYELIEESEREKELGDSREVLRTQKPKRRQPLISDGSAKGKA